MFGWLKSLWARLVGSKTPTVVMNVPDPDPEPVLERTQAPTLEQASEQTLEPTPRPALSLFDTCTVEKSEGPEIEYRCSHRGTKQSTFNLFGESWTFVNDAANEKELCASCCLAKLRPRLIRCVLCGHVIGPGMKVTIYPDNDTYRKEWKTTVGEGEQKGVIGCLRLTCGPDQRRFSGIWAGDHLEPLTVIGGGEIVYTRVVDRNKLPN